MPIFGWFRTFGTVLFLFLGYSSEISEWSTPASFLVGMATAAKLGDAMIGAVSDTEHLPVLKICLKAYAIRPCLRLHSAKTQPEPLYAGR